MAADETNPRPGDTEPELLRKILTILGGRFSPGDTTEKITAKIILALQAGLAGGTSVTKTYVDTGDTAAIATSEAFATAADSAFVRKSGDTMTGALAFAQPALVASNPSLNDAQTWNNAAVAFTGWEFNTTDSASLSSSLLFDFQYNSATMFNLRKDGRLVLGGRLSVSSTIGAQAASFSFSDAGTNTAISEMVLQRNTSGLAAAGLGMNFDWNIDSTTTANRIAVREIATWTDATDATRTSQFSIQTSNSGVVQTAIQFTGTGTILPAAKTLNIAAGANSRAGNVTLTGTTTTVANTTVTANTIVILSRKTTAGTPGTAVGYTLNPGVGFSIISVATDTSVFSYFLIENS